MSERKKEPIERAVGCLGWFWDSDEWDRKRIGVLKAVKMGFSTIKTEHLLCSIDQL